MQQLHRIWTVDICVGSLATRRGRCLPLRAPRCPLVDFGPSETRPKMRPPRTHFDPSGSHGAPTGRNYREMATVLHIDDSFGWTLAAGFARSAMLCYLQRHWASWAGARIRRFLHDTEVWRDPSSSGSRVQECAYGGGRDGSRSHKVRCRGYNGKCARKPMISG